MNDAEQIVMRLLETDEDPKDFVERSWLLDINDLKADLLAEGFKTLGVHVLRNQMGSTDNVHVHVYVEGDPNKPFPIDRQKRIKEIIVAWAAASHTPIVAQEWVPTIITRSAHMYHLDNFMVVDRTTKIINTDN